MLPEAIQERFIRERLHPRSTPLPFCIKCWAEKVHLLCTFVLKIGAYQQWAFFPFYVEFYKVNLYTHMV